MRNFLQFDGNNKKSNFKVSVKKAKKFGKVCFLQFDEFLLFDENNNFDFKIFVEKAKKNRKSLFIFWR